MANKRFLIKSVFFIPLFIFGVSKPDIFASRGEYEQIKELEKQERRVTVEKIVRDVPEYKAESLRDPFIKLEIEVSSEEGGQAAAETVSGAPPSLSVQGVIWGGAMPQAIINDQVVKVGDTIQGAKVISIGKEGIGVLFDGAQYNLSSPAGSTGK